VQGFNYAYSKSFQKRELPPGKVAMSATTYGELCSGAEKSLKPKETRHILEHPIASIPVTNNAAESERVPGLRVENRISR